MRGIPTRFRYADDQILEGLAQNRPQISILEEDNQQSVVNLIGNRESKPRKAEKYFLETMKHIDPQRFGQTEKEITKWANPDTVTKTIRKYFWLEYDNVIRKGGYIDIENIYRGVCSRERVWQIFKKDRHVAFILTPPTDYYFSLIEILEKSKERLLEALDLSVVRKNGSLDTGAVSTILKIYDKVDQRLFGAITQKVQSQNLNINSTIPAAELPPLSPTEVETMRIEVESRDKALQGEYNVRDENITEAQTVTKSSEGKSSDE